MDKKRTILIVDDSFMNREILSDILSPEYKIIEAENGQDAVEKLEEAHVSVDLILLDIIMPVMDGFAFLVMMNKRKWIEKIPVIIISAENKGDVIGRAYDLGVSDYIERPFDAQIVLKRVKILTMLYAKQNRLVEMVSDQMYERQKSNDMMVQILAHIVEFRNGESGMHVLHVNTLTSMILERVLLKTTKYALTASDVSTIRLASSLHDIGKIAVPDGILNKPGRLTKEEFEVMKSHSMIGAEMLEGLPMNKDDSLIRYAYEICRWHHERYDGRGYPDGLAGDDIPISAQVVGMADVYDALTSKRVYKDAFSHEKAMEMILNGECGAFSPLLYECLTELSDDIREELNIVSYTQSNKRELDHIIENMLEDREVEIIPSPLPLLREEQAREQLLESMLHPFSPRNMTSAQLWLMIRQLELVFDDVRLIDVDNVTQYRLDEDGRIVPKPYKCYAAWGKTGVCENCTSKKAFKTKGKETKFESKGGDFYHVISRYVNVDGTPYVLEMVSRISAEAMRENYGITNLDSLIREYNRKLYIDSLTGVYNRRYYDEQIQNLDNDDGLAMIDIDNFKMLNDTYGHLTGDEILRKIAKAITLCVRNTDAVIRFGGDEFLVVLRNIPADAFARKLEQIRLAATTVNAEKDMNCSISISVGGVCREGKVADKIREADAKLYEAKVEKNKVAIWNA